MKATSGTIGKISTIQCHRFGINKFTEKEYSIKILDQEQDKNKKNKIGGSLDNPNELHDTQ